MFSHSVTTLKIVTSPVGDVMDAPALIPPGEYQLKLEYWVTWLMWGKHPKVIVVFSVADPGEFFGVRVSRYYNVRKLIGKPGRNGRFNAHWNCDLVREYSALISDPKRTDRIYFDRLKPLILRGLVRTVNKTAKQQDWPEALRYSVVERLTGIEAGVPA